MGTSDDRNSAAICRARLASDPMPIRQGLAHPKLASCRELGNAEKRGGAPEGRGGAPNELPPEERLSIMSIWRARSHRQSGRERALQNEGFGICR